MSKQTMQPRLSERQIEQIEELKMRRTEEIKELLAHTPWTKDECPAEFTKWLAQAIVYEHREQLRCDTPTFFQLLRIAEAGEAEFNMPQYGYASNCIEARTAIEMQMGPGQFAGMLSEIQEAGERWTKKCAELTNPITERYSKLISMVENNKPIIMPERKKIIT
jgi:hypothetical protein